MLHVRGADGVDVGIGLAPSWKGTLYGTPLMATLAVEAAFCNELRKQCSHLVPFLFGETNLHGADGIGEKRAPCTRGVDESRASGATTPAPRNRKVRTKQEAHAD